MEKSNTKSAIVIRCPACGATHTFMFIGVCINDKKEVVYTWRCMACFYEHEEKTQ